MTTSQQAKMPTECYYIQNFRCKYAGVYYDTANNLCETCENRPPDAPLTPPKQKVTRQRKSPLVENEDNLIDPYELLRQRDQKIINTLTNLDKRFQKIEDIWGRLLGVSHSQSDSEKENPSFIPPVYDQSVAEHLPLPKQDKDNRPIWEIERQKQPETVKKPEETKKKISKARRNLMLIGLLVVVLLLIAGYLRTLGWSCAIPGMFL